MKAGELIDLLMLYDHDDEIQIDVYDMQTGKHIDTIADITIEEANVYCPTLRIDIEAGRLG